MYQTFIKRIRKYKLNSYICGSFIKIFIMKKTNNLFTFGRVYAGLTVLATLVMMYLNVVENFHIPWYWVTVPVWGSLVVSLAFIGLCYLIVFYWGNNIDRWNEKAKK